MNVRVEKGFNVPGELITVVRVAAEKAIQACPELGEGWTLLRAKDRKEEMGSYLFTYGRYTEIEHRPQEQQFTLSVPDHLVSRRQWGLITEEITMQILRLTHQPPFSGRPE